MSSLRKKDHKMNITSSSAPAEAGPPRAPYLRLVPKVDPGQTKPEKPKAVRERKARAQAARLLPKVERAVMNTVMAGEETSSWYLALELMALVLPASVAAEIRRMPRDDMVRMSATFQMTGSTLGYNMMELRQAL